MRTKMFLITILALMLAFSLTYAAGTPAGTAITNFATGEYRDANGNELPNVTSNTVTTIVTQIAGVDISPASTSSNVVFSGSVTFPLVVTNTGNGTDSFDLSKVTVETGGGVNTAELYYDANGNGVVDVDESTVIATSSLAADATYDIIVVVTNVSGDDGSYCTTTLTATSQFNSGVSVASSIISTLSSSVMDLSVVADNQSPKPGDIVTYTFTGINNGSATAKNVYVTCPIPTNTTYVPGSLTKMGMSFTDALDADGSDYNISSANAATFFNGDAAAGFTGYFGFQVRVNDDVPLATIINSSAIINYDNVLDEAQQPVSANTADAKLTVSQLFSVEVGIDKSTIGDPGDFVYYSTTVTNTGNGPDVLSISYTNAMTTWEFYFDHNADGLINNGDVLITDSNLDSKLDAGTQVQNAVVYLIAKAQIPAGASDGFSSIMTMIATSVGDATVSDEGKLTVTVTAPVLSLTKTVSPIGNQPPGTTLTYTCTLTNSGSGVATQVVISDNVPANTTFESGTMKIESSTKTDVSDGDGATHSGNAVIFEVPQLGPGGSTSISFQATIN